MNLRTRYLLSFLSTPAPARQIIPSLELRVEEYVTNDGR